MGKHSSAAKRKARDAKTPRPARGHKNERMVAFLNSLRRLVLAPRERGVNGHAFRRLGPRPVDETTGEVVTKTALNSRGYTRSAWRGRAA